MSHLVATGQVGQVQVAQAERLRADPLLAPPFERPRPVVADVGVHDLAVDADRVVGVLLAVDELLDVHLIDMTHFGDRGLQLRRVIRSVGVHRAGAGDRLDDDRVADLFRRRAHAGGVLRRRVLRSPDPGCRDFLLHQVLVAEWLALVDGHTAGAQLLAQARGQEHARLPETDHPIDLLAFGPLRRRLDDSVLVLKAGHSHVSREMLLRQRRHVSFGLVADADHRSALEREPANEKRHLIGIARGDHHDIHRLLHTQMPGRQGCFIRARLSRRKSAVATPASPRPFLDDVG